MSLSWTLLLSQRFDCSTFQPSYICLEERLQKWKEHFKNQLENPPEITDKYCKEIMNDQLDIKHGQFMEVEFDVVLKKIKSRKAVGLDEISPEIWKTRKFDDILLRFYNAVYKQDTTEKWTKSCIHYFPKKGVLGITKNYRGITLTAKVHYTLLLNRIPHEVKIVL